MENLDKIKTGFSACFCSSLGAEEGGLLDISLFDLPVLVKRGEEMRDTLIGELGEGRALGLDFLDRLGHIRGDEEGEEFSLQALILYLRSSGLAGSGSLLVEEGKLIFKPRNKTIGVLGIGGVHEVEERVEEVALGELGRRSGGHGRLLRK